MRNFILAAIFIRRKGGKMINVTRREPVIITGSEGLEPKITGIFVAGMLLGAIVLLLALLPESNGYQMTLDYNLVP